LKAEDIVNSLISSGDCVASLTSFTTGTPGLLGIDLTHVSLFLSLRYSVAEQNLSGHMQSVDELEARIEELGTVFDVIFIDPWHTFEDSFRMLDIAARFTKSSGYIVVHDCLPTNVSLSPSYVEGRWSGETYVAFRCWVSGQNRDWFVLDDDFGVGVVGPDLTMSGVDSVSHPLTRAESLTPEAVRTAFESDARELMRAVAPEQFTQAIECLTSAGDVCAVSTAYLTLINEGKITPAAVGLSGSLGSNSPAPIGTRFVRFVRQKKKELRTLFTV
jgi:hypothetical protein